jgi:hypothetical protein
MYRLLPRTIEKVRTFSRTASTLFKKAASTLFKKALLVGPYLEQSRKDCKITLDGCTRRRAHTQHIPLGGHGDVGELIKPMLKCLVPIHRSSGTSNFPSGFDVLPPESCVRIHTFPPSSLFHTKPLHRSVVSLTGASSSWWRG